MPTINTTTTTRTFGSNLTNSPTKNPHLKNTSTKILGAEMRALDAFDRRENAKAANK